MSSIDDVVWRELAWISHTNATWNSDFPVANWFRHRLLHDVAFEFRDLNTRELRAQGLFAWLRIIRAEGALRLSLRLAHETTSQRVRWADDNMVVVHYADRECFWRLGDECFEEPPWDYLEPFFSADAYQAAVDAYWFVGKREAISHTMPAINWSQERIQLQSSLAPHATHELKSDLAAVGFRPLGLHHPQTDDSFEMSTLPDDPRLEPPHSLLAALARAHYQYDNDTNTKNDSSLIQLLSEPERRRFEDDHAAVSAALRRIIRLASIETRWRVDRDRWRTSENLYKRAARDRRANAASADQARIPSAASASGSAEQPVPTPWVGLIVVVTLIGGAAALAWHFPKWTAAVAGVYVATSILKAVRA